MPSYEPEEFHSMSEESERDKANEKRKRIKHEKIRAISEFPDPEDSPMEFLDPEEICEEDPEVSDLRKEIEELENTFDPDFDEEPDAFNF